MNANLNFFPKCYLSSFVKFKWMIDRTSIIGWKVLKFLLRGMNFRMVMDTNSDKCPIKHWDPTYSWFIEFNG